MNEPNANAPTTEEAEKAITAALKPLKRNDVTELVVEHLRDLLQQGVLKPGSKLPPEPEISRLLGISRPSLRQAYKALSILGMLRAVPGDGTYISNSTSKILSMPLTFLMLVKKINLSDIFEFRMMLEVELARMAAERASATEVEAMTSEIESMAANMGDHQKDRYLAAEYSFHNCIARAAHNHLLLEIVSIVSGVLWEARKTLVNIVIDRLEDLAEHRAILVAIAQHDPQGAARAMRHHLTSALELAKKNAVIQEEVI